MATKAGNESTTDTESSGPPTTVFIYPSGGRCTTIAIGQLARLVAALPSHHFVPLNDAFAQAKDRLGSYSLAAHDFTQYARARRLTLAARVIWPDHTEQAFILRPVFWQWFQVYDALRPVGDTFQRDTAAVRQMRGNPTSLIGRWYFFVGRRRFARLYSTTAPNKPAAPEPAQPSLEMPVSASPPPQEPTQIALLVEAALAVSASPPPPTAAPKEQHRWQLDRAISALRKRYPPDGKVPAGKTIEAVRGEVDGDLAAENKRLGKASPGWDVVKRAIQILGRCG